jgi:LysR family transcriptional regulator, regulator of abg operon
MKYHHLRAFDAVVRAGGIRAAARELGLTQGAVTKAIRELEAAVGGSLILRGAQGVNLTTYGRQLAERARLIVSQMQAAEDDVAQLREGAGGRLCVGVSSTVSETILPRVVTRLRERIPGVRLRILEATLPASIADLRDGTLDLAVVGAGAASLGKDLIQEPLMQVGKRIAGRHGHPLAGARSVRELADAVWVLSEDPSSDTDPMHRFFTDAGMAAPANIVEGGSLHAAVALAANSDIVTALPEPVLALEHVGRRLMLFDVAERLPPSSYVIVRRANTPLSPAGVLIVDLLRRFAETVAGG